MTEPLKGKPPEQQIQNGSVLAAGSPVTNSSAVPGRLKPAASKGSAEETPSSSLGSRGAGRLDPLPKHQPSTTVQPLKG